jgi:hypothetical protein
MNNDNQKRLIKHSFYPLPTLRALFYYAAVFGLCCYAIIRNNANMAFTATFLLVCPILSLLYGFICFCGISAELEFGSPSLRKCEKGTVCLTVYNYFPLPLAGVKGNLYLPKADKDGMIYARTPVKQKLGVTMGGRRAVSATREVCFGYAGRYDAFCRSVSVYDPMGLFRFVSRVCLNDSIGILPVNGIKSEDIKVSAMMGEGIDRNRPGDERDEVYEIADYVPGDRLKDIHWKKSAREEELQIIKFAAPKEKCQCILCDMGDYFENDASKNPKWLDTVIEAAYGKCISVSAEGATPLLAWREGDELIGVTATTEQAFAAMCKSGHTENGKRIDPQRVMQADGVSLFTGVINADTAKQIVALQTEASNIKGISVILCTPADETAVIDRTTLKKLETTGVSVGHTLSRKDVK